MEKKTMKDTQLPRIVRRIECYSKLYNHFGDDDIDMMTMILDCLIEEASVANFTLVNDLKALAVALLEDIFAQPHEWRFIDHLNKIMFGDLDKLKSDLYDSSPRRGTVPRP
jgi:hypothetical protein